VRCRASERHAGAFVVRKLSLVDGLPRRDPGVQHLSMRSNPADRCIAGFRHPFQAVQAASERQENGSLGWMDQPPTAERLMAGSLRHGAMVS